MKSFVSLAALALSLSLLVGCSGSTGDESSNNANPEAAPGGDASAHKANVPPKEAGPDVVVSTFLDSLREGNDATAAALLTDKARDETAKADLEVKPPGSKSATYSVGTVSYVTANKDGAHVTSIWTDAYPDGTTETYNVIWVLRLQPNGWRIVGLSTRPSPDMAEIFLNFENPEAMLAKVQQAESEAAAKTAAKPQDGTGATVPR